MDTRSITPLDSVIPSAEEVGSNDSVGGDVLGDSVGASVKQPIYSGLSSGHLEQIVSTIQSKKWGMFVYTPGNPSYLIMTDKQTLMVAHKVIRPIILF